MTLSASLVLQEKQGMLFAGALWPYGNDRWGVGIEYIRLAKALESINQFLGLEFITASGSNIAAALKEPASIFHYSGHTDAEKGRGYLVREVNPQGSGALQTMYIPMYSEELANLLPNAQTRLAVFSACNSGRWVFAEPLLRAGLPALIGTQGSVSVQGAGIFSEKLYAALAVGLTLDEAIIGARFQLLKEGGFNGNESLEWGTFMVYMPATDATLLPRAKEQSNVTSFQEAARQTSQQTITAVNQRMGPAPQTASAVDQRSLRNAIVERFTVEEEATLCADIKLDLENDGVALDLDLDTVGGPAHGEEAMVLKLINYLDRRGYLSYLVNAVRRARPGAI